MLGSCCFSDLAVLLVMLTLLYLRILGHLLIFVARTVGWLLSQKMRTNLFLSVNSMSCFTAYALVLVWQTFLIGTMMLQCAWYQRRRWQRYWWERAVLKCCGLRAVPKNGKALVLASCAIS